MDVEDIEIIEQKGEEESPWQNLTDPLLLDIFSHLDAKSLLNVAQTCKHWYRLAHYDRLWKYLLHRHFKQPIPPSNDDLSWEEEYKRMTYHVPDQLLQTCEGHKDEIYHVAFSPSGQYFSTTGKDGRVCLWRYNTRVQMIKSDRFVKVGYSRYSEFNQSETMLLIGGLVGTLMHEGYICIASIPNFELLYAVKGEYANFRGTWLDDRTFLNTGHYFDDRTYFKLDAHTVSKVSHTYPPEDIENIFVQCQPLGKQVLKVFPCNPRNDFVQVIDPMKWRNFSCKTIADRTESEEDASSCDIESDVVRGGQENRDIRGSDVHIESEDISDDSLENEKFVLPEEKSCELPVVQEQFNGWRPQFSLDDPQIGKIIVLCHASRYEFRDNCLAFYYITGKPVTDVLKPYRTLELKAGVLGLRISHNHRYLIYNRRQLMRESEIGNFAQYYGGAYYHVAIETAIYDIYSEKHLDTIYKGSQANHANRLSYVFPDMNKYFIANGGESHFIQVWDRRTGAHLAEIVHDVDKDLHTHSGVNAVKFHPLDPEVLISVADDNKVFVWMSRNRKDELELKQKHLDQKNSRVSHLKQSDKFDRDDKGDNDEDGISAKKTTTCCFCTRRLR